MFRRSRSGQVQNERSGEPAALLVVGLGNPGREYADTRHNVGFMVVEVLADRHGGSLRRSRQEALVAEVRIGGERVALAMPQTFMNESGRSVGQLVRRHGIDDPTRLVIVHDELDLAPGVLRLKAGGGLAGHNGLRSITSHLGTQDYLRVRIGVGKPPDARRGAEHVLKRPGRAEAAEIQAAVAEAADAVEAILADGIDEAMGRYNAGP
ncbi:MAG: aminoacyl-tRNA hydrolase [Acidimicrobiales bacterium]|nr:aminoacyl-tRNA hydrolase [Acidimicrobiales bacterium]